MRKGLVPVTLAVFLSCIMTLSPALVPAQESRPFAPAETVKSGISDDSDQYIIGPEDVLFISVWKEESLTRQVTVRMDGKISLPLVDEITAAGLTPLQLKDELVEKLKGFVADPILSVMVVEAKSFKAYVSGEVKTPAVLRITSEMTLVRLITMAGGFTEWANQKKVLIIRKEHGKDKRIIVNYKKIIDGEEPDVVIQRGDRVIVQ